MRKALEYILTILAIVCMVFALIGRIRSYNLKPSGDDFSNKEDYSSFETNGTKFDFYTDNEINTLNTSDSALVTKDIKGHGKVEVLYTKSDTGISALLKIKENGIFTKKNEIIESILTFKDYIIVCSKHTLTNNYTINFIKEGIVTKEIKSFDYNNYKFYPIEVIGVKDDTFTIKATILYEEENYYLSDGTLKNIQDFPNTEAYIASFNINYMNKVLFDPTMTDDRQYFTTE